ncbi:hypothetical protein C8Q74DRAFT_1212437, partial [Fomes fomentarius]
AQSYDAFLASEALIKQTPRLIQVGPDISKSGMFPALVSRSEGLVDNLIVVRSTFEI